MGKQGFEFDIRTALLLAAVCGQTYNQFSNEEGMHLVPLGYQVTASFEATFEGGAKERFGFILESGDTVIVAFRGTVSAIDWITDIIARQRKYPFTPGAGWTHQGFTDVYGSIRPAILSALKQTGEDKMVYVTGHSLGAALATLCAIDLAANLKRPDPVVYTFGSPRVGDSAFASAYNLLVPRSHRVHNSFDVVSQLPPLIYKSPKTDTFYHYLHVKNGYPLRFRKGSASGNHVLGSYFAALAEKDSAAAVQLCRANPGLCP